MQAGSRGTVPQAQVRILVSRSGNVCAYPGCNRELVLDSTGPAGGSKAVGKVAHIAAASVGGPRFDAGMTSVQRSSAANLIYLCSDHHDLIDTDVIGHPTANLISMRIEHEAAVRRAVRAVTASVSYETLAIVCAVVASQSASPMDAIELSLPTREKIDLNDLTESSAQLIEAGLAQAARVQNFIAFQSSQISNFEQRLTARIRADYQEAIASDLRGDDAFEFVLSKAVENSGPVDTSEIRAAALSVVALMFEICEIFEHE